MTFIIDGTAGETFPDSTTQSTSALIAGKTPYSALPAGSVLQVVQTLSQASASTTSSSWTTTGVSASITPKFSTSKILMMITGQMYETNASNQGFMTVYRGAQELTGGVSNGFPPSVYAGTGIVAGASMNYLDFPATTSNTTYTIYIRTTGGGSTLYWNGANSLVTIILMEIAA